MPLTIFPDFSAAEAVLDYFHAPDDRKANAILDHPAYRLLMEHSRRFSSCPLDREALKASLLGDSRTVDFSGARERADLLAANLAALRADRDRMVHEFAPLAAAYLPVDFDRAVPVYFLVGGFNGIACDGQVALNLDWPAFREDLTELMLYLPHEFFHVGFEQVQRVPDPARVVTRGDLRELVMSFTMNEGLATLVPLEKRIALGKTDDPDYRVLQDEAQSRQCVRQLLEVLSWLESPDAPITEALFTAVLTRCSGDRLFYTAGCAMGRAIERAAGRQELLDLLTQPVERFFEAGERACSPCLHGVAL